MDRGDWVRRKPGSIKDTPASDDVVPLTPGHAALPSLPKRRPGEHRPGRQGEHQQGRLGERRPADADPLPRRRPGEHRPGPRASGQDLTGTRAQQSRMEPPQLSDNVRSLFKPVLIAPAADADVPVESRAAGLAGGHGGLRPVPGSVARRGAGQGRDDQPLQRLVPRATEAGSRRRFGRQVVWLVALTVLALLTAVGTVVALVQLHASGARLSADTGQAGPGVQTGLSGAATARVQASAWIAREISRGSIIACDSLMCADLSRAGVPSLNLLLIRPTTPDPLAADVVAATSVLRSHFGRRLSSEYAPSVLASFGTGATRVDVRAVAADGAAAYESALRQDVAARKAFGTRLLANTSVTLSASAKADLAAGLVDPRLLMTLPVLAGQHPIVILGFYDRGPGAGPGVPLSGAEFSASDSQAAGMSPAAYHRWLVGLLLSQRPPFNSASVRTTVTNGLPIVYVRFPKPSPFGLIHV